MTESFSTDELHRGIQRDKWTDGGNVERFADNFEGELIYAPGLGWHIWRDGLWRLDDTNDVLHLTNRVASRLQAETNQEELEGSALRAFTSHFSYTSSLRGRKALLELAQVDPRFKVRTDELNADPWLLNVANGTLELRTGQLRESVREDYNTLRASVAYDASATCPRFDELLEFAFPGDPVMRAYVMRVAGYALTGNVEKQAFFFLHGVRGSAKTTICEILLHLLGTYAGTLPENALTGSGDEHPTWMMDLIGKRMVYQDELNANSKLNTARINRLTGGASRVKARWMRKDFVDVLIQCKIFASSNHKPKLGNSQDGIWRRIQPWHFKHAVPRDQRIEDYWRLLVAEEGPGILNRCLEGLDDYRRNGLAIPGSVEADALDYQQSEDQLTPFVEDLLVKTGDHDDWVASDDIVAAYVTWCQDNHIKRHDQLEGNQLTKRLVELGYERYTSATGQPVVRKAHRRHNGATERKNCRGFVGLQLARDDESFYATTGWQPVSLPLPSDTQ